MKAYRLVGNYNCIAKMQNMIFGKIQKTQITKSNFYQYIQLSISKNICNNDDVSLFKRRDMRFSTLAK